MKNAQPEDPQLQVQKVKDEAYQFAEMIQRRAVGDNPQSIDVCNSETAALIIGNAEERAKLISTVEWDRHRKELNRKLQDCQDSLVVELQSFGVGAEAPISPDLINKLKQSVAGDVEKIMKESLRAFDPHALNVWMKARDELKGLLYSGKN